MEGGRREESSPRPVPTPLQLLLFDSDSNTEARAERRQASGKNSPPSSPCRRSGADTGRERGGRQADPDVGTPHLTTGKPAPFCKKKKVRLALCATSKYSFPGLISDS